MPGAGEHAQPCVQVMLCVTSAGLTVMVAAAEAALASGSSSGSSSGGSMRKCLRQAVRPRDRHAGADLRQGPHRYTDRACTGPVTGTPTGRWSATAVWCAEPEPDESNQGFHFAPGPM